jgi:hypothetical protein
MLIGEGQLLAVVPGPGESPRTDDAADDTAPGSPDSPQSFDFAQDALSMVEGHQ